MNISKQDADSPSQYARLAYRTLDTELKGGRHEAFREEYDKQAEAGWVPSVEDLFNNQFISLEHWLGILHLGKELIGNFALLNAQNHKIEVLGMLAAAIMTSKNVRQMLTMFESHGPMLEQNATMQVGRVKGGMTLSIGYPGLDPEYAPIWCYAGFNMMEDGIHRATLWRGDKGGETSVVFHMDVPANAIDVDNTFYSEVSFDEDASVGGFGWTMTISDELLDTPNYLYSERVNLLAIEACTEQVRAAARRKARRERVGECTMRVTQYMNTSVALPSQEKVARTQGITPRALQKRLASEGTNFQSIKDAVMLNKIEIMMSGGATAEKVAERLQVSKEAMYRKVKKMTGMTINEHMKKFAGS